MTHTLKDIQNFAFVFLASISVYKKWLKLYVTRVLATNLLNSELTAQESVGLCGGNITLPSGEEV